LRIRGLHNAANALAALALARAIDLPAAPLLHALREYRGERTASRCRDDRRRRLLDDSKGTNVGATVAALDGLAQKIVLIAGGDGKGQDFAPRRAGRALCRAVVLIGRDAPALRATLADTGVPLADRDARRRGACGRRARRAGRRGAAVAACASLDMFRNYAHRAQVFRARWINRHRQRATP
jgi:UDP-N-acetylmuramoylalanine--D-glutamate ligase